MSTWHPFSPGERTCLLASRSLKLLTDFAASFSVDPKLTKSISPALSTLPCLNFVAGQFLPQSPPASYSPLQDPLFPETTSFDRGVLRNSWLCLSEVARTMGNETARRREFMGLLSVWGGAWGSSLNPWASFHFLFFSQSLLSLLDSRRAFMISHRSVPLWKPRDVAPILSWQSQKDLSELLIFPNALTDLTLVSHVAVFS